MWEALFSIRTRENNREQEQYSMIKEPFSILVLPSGQKLTFSLLAPISLELVPFLASAIC
jgi:hypothetical protein